MRIPDGLTLTSWRSFWSSSGLGRDYGKHSSALICQGHGSDGGFGSQRYHAEEMVKYCALFNTHFFTPLAPEALRPINIAGQHLLPELGRKLMLSTGINRRPASYG